ncbi:hypothetical protein AB0M05_27515 [Streptomyces violaceusniger]
MSDQRGWIGDLEEDACRPLSAEAVAVSPWCAGPGAVMASHRS